jgi:hypothetical protein
VPKLYVTEFVFAGRKTVKALLTPTPFTLYPDGNAGLTFTVKVTPELVDIPCGKLTVSAPVLDSVILPE